jgi:hypothetical protein
MKRDHAKSVPLARVVAVTAGAVTDAAKAADNGFEGSLSETSFNKARDAKILRLPLFQGYLRLRKFLSIWRPFSVRMLSGWNCTPQIGYCLWRTPMTSPSSVSAVISRQSGTLSR